MAWGPRRQGTPVWVHFGIDAGVRYCAIRLLWTYVTCFAEFIVHDEKTYGMRHFQFTMISWNISVLYGDGAPLPPRDLARGLPQTWSGPAYAPGIIPPTAGARIVAWTDQSRGANRPLAPDASSVSDGVAATAPSWHRVSQT